METTRPAFELHSNPADLRDATINGILLALCLVLMPLLILRDLASYFAS